ncbi:MAG: hypothetical protein CBC13_07650 [Planctomycetia bacterium TMED53]|nr:MAG: hypothetical protein CBC13_07650 [Planctomycetia bacterium TMED53]
MTQENGSRQDAKVLLPDSTVGESVFVNERQPTPSVGVIYENDAWLKPLFEALSNSGISHEGIDVRAHGFDLLAARKHTLYLNRVSPSSYMRGNAGAIAHAHALLATLEATGSMVVNGSRSFRMETSKVSQQLLMNGLGVLTPETHAISNPAAITEMIDQLRFPLILKPDTGGSGALIRRIENREQLMALIDDPEVFPSGHLMLLQEIITSVDGTISRVEFVDGEFLLAMKVKPQNTFNLCPAEGCPRNPIEAGVIADATFEAWPDVPQDAVAQAREILRAAQLDIGGVEWMDTADGRRVFIDINATSVYREDMQKALGVDGFQVVCDYLTRELAKEAAKSELRIPRRLG